MVKRPENKESAPEVLQPAILEQLALAIAPAILTQEEIDAMHSRILARIQTAPTPALPHPDKQSE